MMPAPLVLTFKTARFEWITFTIAAALAGLGAVAAALYLGSMAPPPACAPLTWGSEIAGGDLTRCPVGDFLDFRGAIGDRLAAVIPWLPVFGGAVIGSQLVSRDVEQRTNQLMWALDPTRRRWFVERVLVAASGLAAAAVFLAISAQSLASARFPGLDVGTLFATYGEFGIVVVVRGLAALCVGLMVGALLGRVVPSVLASIALSAAIVLLTPVLALKSVPTQIVDAGMTQSDPSIVVIDGGWMTPDGRILDQEAARALAPNPQDPVAAQEWVADNLRAVSIQVSGVSVPTAVLVETVALGAVGAAALLVAYIVVQRRRVL